jgi:hypothetical protein
MKVMDSIKLVNLLKLPKLTVQLSILTLRNLFSTLTSLQFVLKKKNMMNVLLNAIELSPKQPKANTITRSLERHLHVKPMHMLPN